MPVIFLTSARSLFPVLEELGITFIAFSPMGNGFLSGKYTPDSQFESGTDFRSAMPQYTKEGFEKSKALLEFLNDMAAQKNATPGQLSMAWMLCKKPYIVPIPGSRKLERIRENFGAGNVILTPKEVKAIDDKLDTMKFIIFGGH